MNIFIKTFGCPVNFSDSEKMAGLLKQAKFKIVNAPEKADLIIINSCTVKTPTEINFFKYLEKTKQLNKKIIIAGCIPQTDPEKLSGYSLIGTSQIDNVVEIVEETINNNTIESIIKQPINRLEIPNIRKNPIIEIIPICEGCLGDPCAYCKVKAARGNLKSYKQEDIIKQAKKAVINNAKEIWLTAQDTGCYGLDINTNLPNLLKEIIKISGNYKIRLGMANPNHIITFLDELTEIYKSDKIFKFLHIPVQSGNNEILKSMKRKYTIEQFKQIIEKFRKEIPEITISTDIICGFPGETQEQFNDSLDLIKQITPDILNISRFWPRPKTAADEMKAQIHGRETKRRSRLLTDIFYNIARMQNEKWLDWQGEIIIDEKGKGSTSIGRNYSYKPVIVKGDYNLGEKLTVKIKKITSFDLRGEIK